MEIKDRIQKLLEEAGSGLYEKEQILALALLSAVAGESIFLLGPPGTAKSLVARRLKEVFSRKRCFEYLMSRFSTPDEIFGPVSIRQLKESDSYRRNTEGFLPWATVVFLDEIWKAGPAIQNALLTVLNERIFQNGSETMRLPLRAVIAASNELPAEGEGLEALWDRFLIRAVSNCIADEATFHKMLRTAPGSTKTPEIEEDLLITDSDLEQWRQGIDRVTLDDSVLAMVSEIRRRLKALSLREDADPLDFYVSDRRWVKAMNILKTSAFLNGRDSVDASDMLLLVHMLWNNEHCIPDILNAVGQAMHADVQREVEAMDTATQALMENISARRSAADSAFKTVNFLYYSIADFRGRPCLISKSDYKQLRHGRETDGTLHYDNNLGSQVIRKFGTTPVRGAKSGAAEPVKIAKTPRGMTVDGEEFQFVRLDGEATEPASMPGHDELEAMQAHLEHLKQLLDRRTAQITRSHNLFLSAEDMSLPTGDLTGLRKRMDELEIRIAGALLI